MKSVFIVTWGRTGSTLLNKILNSTPGVDIRGENNNTLWYIFKAWQRAKYMKGYCGPKSHTTSGPWYGAPKVNPDDFAKSLVSAFIN